MSQISVVHYNSLNKINVLQQNNVSNKQGERQVIVLRKTPQIISQPKDNNILLTNTAKKGSKKVQEKDTKSQPIAVRISVARRNARERNRVKQVNNGFANLRQHIPNFIASAFENNSGRGGSKKLSKVETLRMAVEYIRSLENLLALSDNGESQEHVPDLSYSSPSSSASPNSLQNQMTYTYQVLSPPAEEDDPQLTNTTYQIIPTTVYENGENLDPMTVEEHLLADPTLLDSNLEFNVNSQDLSYLNSIQTTSSLSPGFYSDASLSPMSDIKSDPNTYVNVYNTPPEERLSPGVISIKNEDDMPVISLKSENDLPDEHKENIEDVLEWWEQQPQSLGS